MGKKIVKLAVIRSDEGGSRSCPFGLPISEACRNVGDAIYKMAPTAMLGKHASEEEIEELKAANHYVYKWKADGNRCPYAGRLFPKNKEVVECNWGSNAPKVNDSAAIKGSPFFYRVFNGTGLDGLYSLPLGYYTDNSIDRGHYYGPFSIESIASKDDSEKD